MGIFGTDGVRGIGCIESVADPLHSFETKGLFTKNLCGEIAHSASRVAEHGPVIVGWDRRPSNLELAKSVIDSLSKTGRRIMVLNETTTPALQFAMLDHDAKLGIMITASHNPAEDTGVKILFENGRKPTIEEEFSIESGLFCGTRSARGESKIEQITNDTYIQHTTQELVDLRKRGLIPEEGFLVDGSGGWISTWLADMISKTGFPCKEVSDRNVGINWKSGAGSLNEGVVIGWEECKISEHSLLRMLEPSPRGSVLGFCFDGDGDRCLLVCSSGDGACVVGGDGFLRLFSQGCRNEEDFSAALTIESALDVGYGLRSLGIGRVTETGVGDRWLQQALIDDVDVNCLVGAEPSGHVVLRHRIGHKIGLWGDGVKTMLELLGMIGLQGDNWLDLATSSTSLKLAYSISPSDRSLWKPDGKSGQLAINSIIQSLNVNSKKVSRVEVNGEDSLLLLKHSGEGEWSFAIRNSGTESKTRVTIRTTGGSEEKVEGVMAAIIDVLEPLLQPDTKS